MHEVSETPVLVRDGVALWRQIGARLREEIEAGQPHPGARLPTEAQLAQRFAVNRHTVRRALDELARDGLVRVEQGRGAFVEEDVLDYLVEPRTRFSAWVRRNAREPGSTALGVWVRPAERQVATALGIAEGAPVTVTERLGLADQRPVALGLHHFDAARFPGLAGALRESATITEALRQVGVADYVRRSTRVTARLPTAQEAALLRTPRTRPLLVCENLNVDLEGTVIEYGLARYPTPRVQVVFEP